MLDDVQRGRFLVHPAGEDPPVLVVRAPHIELEEGAGQLFLLPGSGRLAGAQVNDRVARADRHSRLHPQIVDDPVALVEEADDRHAVLHRGQPGFVALEHLAGVCRLELLLISLLLAPAGREREPERDAGSRVPEHSYSGVQGW